MEPLGYQEISCGGMQQKVGDLPRKWESGDWRNHCTDGHGAGLDAGTGA